MAEAIQVGAIEVEITSNHSGLDSAVQKSGKALDNFDRQASKTAKGVAAGITGMQVSVGAAIAAFIAAMKRASEAVSELSKSSSTLGIAIEQFSRMSFATKALGGTTADLTAALRTLQSRMADTDATSDGVRAFDALGLSMKNANGTVRDASTAFFQVIDRLSQMKDSAEKTRLATMLLGESAINLQKAINGGSGAFRSLMQQSDLLGTTVDRVAQKNLSDMNTALTKLWEVTEGGFTKALVAISPVIKQVADALTEFFTQTNFGKMSLELFTGVVKTLHTALEGALFVVKSIGMGMVSTFEALLAAAQGNFTQAAEIYVQGLKDIGEMGLRAGERISNVWDTTVQKGTEATEALRVTITPAFIDASATIAKAWEEHFRLAGEAMQDVLSTETMPFEAKVKKLNDLVNEGSITWREYKLAMKQVNDEGRRNTEQLLTATAGALTQLFQKSKAAAIASALINTYVGITKAIAEYPPPFSYAMAGIQAALGFKQVAMIKAQGKEGGGGGGGGAVPAPPTEAAGSGSSRREESPLGGQTLFLRGLNPSDIFSGEAVRGLVEKLIDYQRDGGKLVLAPV